MITKSMKSFIVALQDAHASLLENDVYNESDIKPQRLLGLLRRDTLAEVIKFAKSDVRLTWAAVSPKSRLLVEMLEQEQHTNVQLHLNSLTVMHELVYQASDAPWLQPFDKVCWWIEKCGLPLAIKGDAKACSVISSSNLKGMIRSVKLSMREQHCSIPEEVAGQLEQMSMSGAAFAALPITPSSLALLRELHVFECTRKALQLVMQVPHLKKLVLNFKLISASLIDDQSSAHADRDSTVVTSVDMRHMASASTLRSFRLSGPSLVSIDGGACCGSLITFAAVDCGQLTSLFSLGKAPRLRAISISWCGLRNLEGLEASSSLETISIDSCNALERLSALSGIPTLREINVVCSGVREVGDLASCPCLATIRLIGCRHLTDLSPLAGAPRLCTIEASFSGVSNLSGLSKCPSLELVHLDACTEITSLDELADAPRLKAIFVTGINRQSLSYPPCLEHKLLPVVHGDDLV